MKNYVKAITRHEIKHDKFYYFKKDNLYLFFEDYIDLENFYPSMNVYKFGEFDCMKGSRILDKYNIHIRGVR